MEVYQQILTHIIKYYFWKKIKFILFGQRKPYVKQNILKAHIKKAKFNLTRCFGELGLSEQFFIFIEIKSKFW